MSDNAQPLPKLPIGIQGFTDIIRSGYLYVDKTHYIYQLITQGKPYFLSRPRRFGKSLLTSTLEAVFRNQRELFKGLWIDQSDYQWEEYPVVRLDMAETKTISQTPEILEISLIKMLEAIAERYQCQISETDPSFYLAKLIKVLSKKNQVVVLVDEYDKPLLDTIDDLELLKKNRQILKDFYEVLKTQDKEGNLRFIFLTGVTKFSKVSIFSGLNQLRDISLSKSYASLLGYTPEEMQRYFQPWVERLAIEIQCSVTETKQAIKRWYNGYQFSEKAVHVYNPFSTLNLFVDQSFSNFWYESGTPTFLMKLLEKQGYDLKSLADQKVRAHSFSAFEIEHIRLLPLLYQAGYLTIKSYNPKFQSYQLGYPNREVEGAFLESVIIHLSTNKTKAADYVVELSETFDEQNWERFFIELKGLFSNIPYDIQLKQEKYYQSLVYLVFTLIGVTAHAEKRTSTGRMDMLIATPALCVVFEFKLDKSAEEALAQIHEKKYYETYQKTQPGEIILFGVNFSSETRNLEGWCSETIPARG